VVPTSNRVWARELVVGRNHHPASLIAATESDRQDDLQEAWRIDLVRAKAYEVKTSVYSGHATKVRLVKLGNLLKSLVESEKIESTSEKYLRIEGWKQPTWTKSAPCSCSRWRAELDLQVLGHYALGKWVEPNI
jgi:hypothetical protein